MKPCNAKTEKQICKLSTIVVVHGDYSLEIAEGEVALENCPVRKGIIEGISLPRAVFDKFVKWYQTEQKAEARRG